MPGPVAGRIRANTKTDALRRLYIEGVFACEKFSLRIFQFAPHAMQMHGMRHHGVVVEDDAQALAMPKMDGF